ncbi:NINE protein [Candidatus Sulfidibacterium hydrothermale]|jgi:TM2 domain-containing membrane protein YozV|uniref:TM2 domain-containing protein n=1 Tax=Candidatus Sulfidibacterium hydrothermale TaxID=2875962 RepID=UPI001F0A267C|nr:NINE protein [Candidatus Sulfidibacterium hydrothermale]UBM62168.1 NINE protein [Candidatus Sulfidibacterium hydrothermale]
MKSKVAAYLLWFFLGFLSAHRFYLGKYGTAILYLFTGQLFGIGWIIDAFLINGMVEQYNLKTRVKRIETVWV